MDEFSYNSQYLIRNGKPWFPLMGEMHYSRVDRRFWADSLQKMKAGGIDIVSSYVIWIHHEEIEGEFDFSGNKDLWKFIQLCQDHRLYFFLRIGPWVHGEVRHGGFPDWLLAKGFEVRTNDERYFAEVYRFYDRIYSQIKGLQLKEGGPIIGIQIENEYGHCGGLTGPEGEAHMRRLTAMSKEIGFDVPYFTATGWGGAVTAGLLPVMGGYPDAPWDSRLTEIEPSGNYIFTPERNDHNIGSDHHIGYGLTFDPAEFPYLTAELGGGLQVTYHRRPVVTAADIGAMTLVKLGSGVNLLGYYMFRGGSNPPGKRSSLQESRAAGDFCDLPQISYDFRAPIREFGQISDSFREIKRFALFLHDFGEELCKMPAKFPSSNPLDPKNNRDLRTAVRDNGKNGYLFVNNYQRRQKMADHPQTSLRVTLPDETIEFPITDIRDGDYFFFPFNLPIGNSILKSAAATPLCKINDDTTVFYSDFSPQYQFDHEPLNHKIITLSKKQAMNAWKIRLPDGDHLLLSEDVVLQNRDRLEMIGRGIAELSIYPDFPKPPQNAVRIGGEGDFTVYEVRNPGFDPNRNPAEAKFRIVRQTPEQTDYEITLNYPNDVENCYLSVGYQGDQARLIVDGKLSADDFYAGTEWEIGLKQFNFPKKIILSVTPLYAGMPVYLEQWPIIEGEKICRLNHISLNCEYRTIINRIR